MKKIHIPFAIATLIVTIFGSVVTFFLVEQIWVVAFPEPVDSYEVVQQEVLPTITTQSGRVFEMVVTSCEDNEITGSQPAWAVCFGNEKRFATSSGQIDIYDLTTTEGNLRFGVLIREGAKNIPLGTGYDVVVDISDATFTDNDYTEIDTALFTYFKDKK